MANAAQPIAVLTGVAEKPNTQAVAMVERSPPSRLRMLGFLRQRQPTLVAGIDPEQRSTATV
jgi:hypothetical protein